MRKRFLAGIVAAAAVGVTALVPATASATGSSGSTLADILLADDAKSGVANKFDNRFWDYDIVTEAVLLFPDLVEAASNPDAELTVFIPTDAAFRQLVFELTGKWVRSEADVFAAVAGLGVDTVKTVLTYHIVPGAEISYRTALKSDGAVLTTLQTGTIEVDVKGRFLKWISLVDADTNDRNPIVVQANVGGAAANGFAHGIDRVLRPIDLP